MHNKGSVGSGSKSRDALDRRESQDDEDSCYVLELGSVDDESYYGLEEEVVADESASVDGQLLHIFEHYQRARILFAQSIIDVASNPETQPDTITAFQTLGVIQLLCPLLFDIVPSVQGLALVALAKLATHSQDIAKELVKNNVLHLLVTRLKQETEQTDLARSIQPCSEHFKKSALFLFKSIAKHSEELAMTVLKAEPFAVFAACLREPERSIQESAIVTMESIVKHSTDVASTVLSENDELLQQLLSSLPHLPPSGTKAALSMIYEFTKVPKTANKLFKLDVIPILSTVLEKPDENLKRMVLPIFSQLSGSKKKIAEMIANTSLSIEYAIECMSADALQAAEAMEYINESFKYTSEIRQRIIDAGIIPAIIAYIQREEEIELVPAMKCLSTLSSMSSDAANMIIENGGSQPLGKILDGEYTEEVKEITILIIGTMGSYSREHAEALGEAGLLDALARRLIDPDTEQDLRTKCTQNLKKIFQKYIHLPALEILKDDSAVATIGMALVHYNKILKTDGQARRRFVACGWLKKIQEIKPDPHTPLDKLIYVIKSCFPREVIVLSNPEYMEKILEKVQQFRPPKAAQPIDFKTASRDSSQWNAQAIPSNTRESLFDTTLQESDEREEFDDLF